MITKEKIKETNNDKYTRKNNIIDNQVNQYINKLDNILDINIKIYTSVVDTDGNINYRNLKQTVIYKKARDLFSKIGKKSFTNNNEKNLRNQC